MSCTTDQLLAAIAVLTDTPDAKNEEELRKRFEELLEPHILLVKRAIGKTSDNSRGDGGIGMQLFVACEKWLTYYQNRRNRG